MSAPAQYMAALERGNHIRFERAKAKRRLHEKADAPASRREAARLLEHPPDELAAMRVVDLLDACRRHGRKTTLPFLRRAQVSESATIGGLTDRQRCALVAQLRGGR